MKTIPMKTLFLWIALALVLGRAAHVGIVAIHDAETYKQDQVCIGEVSQKIADAKKSLAAFQSSPFVGKALVASPSTIHNSTIDDLASADGSHLTVKKIDGEIDDMTIEADRLYWRDSK